MRNFAMTVPARVDIYVCPMLMVTYVATNIAFIILLFLA
jgi:hypothetical protein